MIDRMRYGNMEHQCIDLIIASNIYDTINITKTGHRPKSMPGGNDIS